MELYGIDISNHQSGIDLSKLKNVDFIIMKATEGWKWTDPSFKNLYEQAKSLGKPLGTYYFARPANNNARDDARYYVSEVKKVQGDTKPVYILDWECAPVSKVSWAKEWLDQVAYLTGTIPWIYMNLNTSRSYDWSSVAKKYPLWLAQYPTSDIIYDFKKGSIAHGTTKYWKVPVMWQFTSTGRITGWSGNLDCNVFYGSKDDWYKYSGQEEESMGLGFKAHKAETQKIIEAHKKDFNYNTAKDYLAKKGGYRAYVKSLGGVFAKYIDFKGKVTTYEQLTEIGDYVWGLYDLFGVDYSNGCSYTYSENIYKAYAKDGSQYYPTEDPKARFKMNYSAFGFSNGSDLPGVDEMFEECIKGGPYYAITNCGQGVVQMLKKAGLCPRSFPDPAEYPAYWKTNGYSYKLIKNTKDLKVGDVLYFFNKKIPNRSSITELPNWADGGFHTAIVGEMTSDGYVLYDSGHAYTYYGEFRNFRNYSDKPYQWAEDWIGLRFDFGLKGGTMNGWKKENGKWYYYDNDKKLIGWHKIKWSKGTDWFYFDSKGVMLTGWQKLKWSKGENWFYFTPDGAMVTGVQYLEWNGKTDWYVFDNNGVMLTGKAKLEVTLDNSGRMTSLSKAKVI